VPRCPSPKSGYLSGAEKQDKSSFEADARMEEAAKGVKSVTVYPASEMQD